MGDTVVPEPSAPANNLHDEIVVGTNAESKADKTPPLATTPDRADIEMAEPTDEQLTASPYPKRKRSAIFNDLSEDKIESNFTEEDPGRLPKPVRPGRAPGGVKGVTLGFWRDSAAPDEKDKHAVIGFIDIRDRLRTRIQPTNREGKNVSRQFPLPPGPGGSWVTFERVAFDPHLVNLDHYQVKEYVKIRAEAVLRDEESPEERAALNTEAVTEAIRRVQLHPPPDTAAAPPVAYGPQIPEHAQISHRPESKKRRIASGTAASTTASPAQNQLTDIPGSRPTRILLGYWKHSSEEDERDKHAVYGILGTNDMFRIKLVRETRDGRPLLGNFPVGAGGLWIQWEELVFEDHLQKVSRPVIKEYCRLRQRQLDQGETPSERHENELLAVKEAMDRVSSNTHGRRDEPVGAPSAVKERPYANGTGFEDVNADFASPGQAQHRSGLETHGLRTSRREVAPRARHSLPDVQLRAANRPQSVDPREHPSPLALREATRAEATQTRGVQRAASRDSSTSTPAPDSNKALFQDNIQRLNKVWAVQEAKRLREWGAEDAKIYMGTKYERKQNGPFEGKLVSQGSIISIDGEDYVEYRVLTKPTFF